MASKYLQFQQEFIFEQIKQLNGKLLQCNTSRTLPSSVLLATYGGQFCHLNADILRTCSNLEAVSRFWQPILTILFPYFIAVQCYLFYLSFFVEMPFEQRAIFALVQSEMAPLFLFLIKQCAKVVQNNGRFLSENRRFYLELCKRTCGKGEVLNVKFLLKVTKK